MDGGRVDGGRVDGGWMDAGRIVVWVVNGTMSFYMGGSEEFVGVLW